MPLRRHAPVLLATALAALPRPGGAGCGSSEYAPGQTVNLRLESGGWNREFQMHVPAGYDEDAPTPVVLYFHGWGGSGSVIWYRAQADASTFLAVAPTGVGGGANPDGGRNSWNGGGSSTSPGPDGPSCAPGSPQYCYTSCAARPQGCHECDWTTCADDFAFVEALLDWLEDNVCVDRSRVFATGHSNGGQFAWALGARLAPRIAAVAPSAGTPHTGFGEAPTSGSAISVMDIHGANDNICPANSTEPSADGWYYEQVPIMCRIFSEPDGCTGVETHYPTTFDGQSELYCVQQGRKLHTTISEIDLGSVLPVSISGMET